MAYAEDIPSQHPNPSEEEMQAQAGQAFVRMCRGETAAQVAVALNISERTVFNRLKMINAVLPPRSSLRAIIYGRSEHFLQRLNDRLDGEVSTADLVKGTAELRQLLDRQVAWLVEEPEPDSSHGDAEIAHDDWEAREL